MPARADSPHARVDRTRTLAFSFDGRALAGHPGDTLASALLANGVDVVARSPYLDRPRGIVSAGIEEPNAFVELLGDGVAEPIVAATTVELYDGLAARGLAGRGRVVAQARPARCDHRHVHCDVLVVGAGPAGLAAADAAAAGGARVVLAGMGPEAGGALLDAPAAVEGADAAGWLGGVAARLDAAPEATVLRRATVLGLYERGYALISERRTLHLGPAAPANRARSRLWHVRARRVVLATGALERPLVFAGNDRPGVMLAGSARAYANRFAVAPGERAVVFTTNDGAYAAAEDLLDRGVAVAAIVDARAQAPAVAERLRGRGVETIAGAAVAATRGGEHLAGVTVDALGADGALAGSPRELACDLLAVSGGWTPTLHLLAQAGGRLRWDAALATHVPGDVPADVAVVGAAAGAFALAEAVAQGREAGRAAAAACGFEAPPAAPAAAPTGPSGPTGPGGPPSDAPGDASPPRALWAVPPLDGDGWDEHFVDVQRDATVADVRRALGAGLRSPEHVKRYTTIGTGGDQGKTSNVNALGTLAELTGEPLDALAPTTYRPPYEPVPFALLAGRDRGVLHDPVRVTAIHPWHEAAGAVFEDVGQWKRPWYYPRADEDMDAAVLREQAAAREAVALMDASTLGKVDVQGPDAGELLDRVYTNLMSTVPVGGCRYGVLCKADGMVFDDGVVMRLAEDRYVTTTTTGNAAAVLDWLEEWVQTEWPELRVHLTSVTDHWAAIAVVGPRAREVLAPLTDVPLDADAFPFMTLRETTVAGAPARLCRVSFSGELAFEVHVPARYGLAVWEALIAAGEPYGIAPYGTETMHVLRAEKGYVIVGQDTDGTVTPQDAGMGWIVSKKKDFFVGRRSHRRPAIVRPDRRQLVGLLPRDPHERLPEGAAIVRDGAPGTAGHVTSSYRSYALGRTFALALLERGFERLGETVRVCFDGRTVPAEVTGPVLYDPEGARRDGDAA